MEKSLSIAERDIHNWAKEQSEDGIRLSWEASNLPINATEQRRHRIRLFHLSRERSNMMRETDALRSRFLELQIKKSRTLSGLGKNLVEFSKDNLSTMDLLKEKSIRMRIILTTKAPKRDKIAATIITNKSNKFPLISNATDQKFIFENKEQGLGANPMSDTLKDVRDPLILSYYGQEMQQESYSEEDENLPLPATPVFSALIEQRPSTQQGWRADDHQELQSHHFTQKPKSARASFRTNDQNDKLPKVNSNRQVVPRPTYQRALEQLRNNRPSTKSAKHHLISDPRIVSLVSSLQPCQESFSVDNTEKVILKVKEDTGYFLSNEKLKSRQTNGLSQIILDDIRDLFCIEKVK